MKRFAFIFTLILLFSCKDHGSGIGKALIDDWKWVPSSAVDKVDSDTIVYYSFQDGGHLYKKDIKKNVKEIVTFQVTDEKQTSGSLTIMNDGFSNPFLFVINNDTLQLYYEGGIIATHYVFVREVD